MSPERERPDSTPKEALTAVGRAPSRLFTDVPPSGALGLAAVAFCVLLGLWWLFAAIDLARDLFLPSPPDVAGAAVDYAGSGELWTDARASFLRVTIGFIISTVIGLTIGVIAGAYARANAAAAPPVEFIRYMPAVAFVPLTIVWIGVDETQKYLVIFIGTFFQQALMVRDNIKYVPREFLNVGLTLGMSDRRILRKIVVPAAAPQIWDTLRLTLGWAWTWLIVAELVAADQGLGYRIVLAQRFLNTEQIFVAILLIGLLGLIMDQLMQIAGRRMFPWAASR